MRFEFDPNKSLLNIKNHKIDFIQAQDLWLGPVLELKSKNPVEPRMLVIGIIANKFWTAIITRRGDAIRIISCRRARDEEKEAYRRHYGG